MAAARRCRCRSSGCAARSGPISCRPVVEGAGWRVAGCLTGQERVQALSGCCSSSSAGASRRPDAPARPKLPPLQGPLLHERFAAVAAARPHAPCLLDDASGRVLSYREVATAAVLLAARLC